MILLLTPKSGSPTLSDCNIRAMEVASVFFVCRNVSTHKFISPSHGQWIKQDIKLKITGQKILEGFLNSVRESQVSLSNAILIGHEYSVVGLGLRVNILVFEKDHAVLLGLNTVPCSCKVCPPDP